jgi:hypothetical protein
MAPSMLGNWHGNKRHGYGVQTDLKSKVIYNGIWVDDTQGGYHHLAGRLQFDAKDSKLDVTEAHPQENKAAALAKALNCAQCGRNPSSTDRPVPIVRDATESLTMEENVNGPLGKSTRKCASWKRDIPDRKYHGL